MIELICVYRPITVCPSKMRGKKNNFQYGRIEWSSNIQFYFKYIIVSKDYEFYTNTMHAIR